MKAEEDNSRGNNACLASETQAIELDFIKTYKQLPILWDVNHPDYTNKYRRCAAIDTLLKIIKKWDSTATRLTVRQKINVLRSSYRKDLRKHLMSKTIGPDGQEKYEYNPKNWKFYALRFLGGQLYENVQHNKNNNIVEINLDNIQFEDEMTVESDEDEPSTHTTDCIQILNEDITHAHKQCYTNTEKNKKRCMKLQVQDYGVDDSMLDREFEAIGSNVACKLKRMNPEQRCHAELLINKVLIEGLKNKLTDDSDLTEGYK